MKNKIIIIGEVFSCSFIAQGKAVFGVEYELHPKEFCPQADQYNFSWLKMDYDLDGVAPCVSRRFI